MPTYLTRLLARIEADTPTQAVDEYQRQLREIPFADRVYRVEDEATGLLVYVYEGSVFTLTELQEHLSLSPADAQRIQDAQDAAQGARE